MSKKFMLLALTVVSAAFFALPAFASAEEIHLENGTGTEFTVEGPPGALKAAGEPTIACQKTSGSGKLTSDTTGEVTLDFLECSTTIAGAKVNCKSSGAATNNTIKTSNIGHLITISTGQPGILVTPPFPTIICGTGLSERKLQVTGEGVIGTITSPTCGNSSTEITLSFKPNGAGTAQEHLTYTGKTYDLQVTTETATHVTGILEGHATLKSAKSLKLVCT